MIDVHGYKRRVENALVRIESSQIIEFNKNKIKEFYRYCLTNGIGYGKLQTYLIYLTNISKIVDKNFNECNKEDIETLMIKLENMNYAEWTKYGFKILVR